MISLRVDREFTKTAKDLASLSNIERLPKMTDFIVVFKINANQIN